MDPWLPKARNKSASTSTSPNDSINSSAVLSFKEDGDNIFLKSAPLGSPPQKSKQEEPQPQQHIEPEPLYSYNTYKHNRPSDPGRFPVNYINEPIFNDRGQVSEDQVYTNTQYVRLNSCPTLAFRSTGDYYNPTGKEDQTDMQRYNNQDSHNASGIINNLSDLQQHLKNNNNSMGMDKSMFNKETNDASMNSSSHSAVNTTGPQVQIVTMDGGLDGSSRSVRSAMSGGLDGSSRSARSAISHSSHRSSTSHHSASSNVHSVNTVRISNIDGQLSRMNSGNGQLVRMDSEATTGSTRQKNDKAVEVHHDHRVIARFRTQTECARYLRATPEAVSYHCSKGGGVCNGLVIQPLSSAEVNHLVEMNARQSGVDRSAAEAMFFGLFEGAVQSRPKERPQLKPETVAILKDWLLSPDHMDNPYPNQRESEMLMERTGLDKTQLKHWFNNARKRILKPLLKNGGRKGSADLRDLPQAKARGGVEGGDKRKPKPNRKKKTGAPTHHMKMMRGSGGGSPSQEYEAQMRHQAAQQQQFHERQQQLLAEEQMNTHPPQFDRPFSGSSNFDMGDSIHNNRQMAMMQHMNQMQMNAGMGNVGSQPGDHMREMMMMNSSRFNEAAGFQGRMGNMSGGMGGFGGNMGMSDYEMFTNFRRNNIGSNFGGAGSQGFMNQEQFLQDQMPGMNSNNGNAVKSEGGERPFGPSSQSPQGAPQDLPQEGALGGAAGVDDTARSNAVFKQQVATMAMNEASTAFKEMEDAFATAKGALAVARAKCARTGDDPEEDPAVQDANAVAKKCQSVAMFKLKVSQRASEEAATAYDSYQQMAGVEGGEGGQQGMLTGEGGAPNVQF